MTRPFVASIIQQPPVPLQREATLGRAVEYVGEAADGGAELIVFPEAFIPGYPDWAWMLHPLLHRRERGLVYEALLGHAVDVDRGDLAPLQDSARRRGVTVVVGVNELSASGSSLYNSLVTIGSDGDILNVHRKLIPTFVERNVWAPGDGAGLQALDAGFARIGGLICWENLMPLARYALYAQGVEVYIVSTYDSGDASIATMQHIAREGMCWVLCSGVALHLDDVPADFPAREATYDIYMQMDPSRGDWVGIGDSVVVDPTGKIVEGPLRREYGILTVEIDPAAARRERWYLDVAGHYQRPDVFQVTVDRRRRRPIDFTADDGAGIHQPADAGDLLRDMEDRTDVAQRSGVVSSCGGD